VLSGDTAPCAATEVAAHRADLLVHEATFSHEEAERAVETAHTTARAAAELAARAEVTLLALTHVSPRYAGPELREEAERAFPATVVPRDLDRIAVPFPERGPPTLVGRSERTNERGAAAVAAASGEEESEAGTRPAHSAAVLGR
jgi:ribonuclease Z